MLPDMLAIAGSAVAAYLLGAIPFALIVGKAFYRTDVREHGSGNLGATNVYRVLGAKAGVAVFALDMAKGALAVAVAMLLTPDGLSRNAADGVLILATFAAILGHSYSPYIRFRGGKGVATAAGALLVLTPYAWPILLTVFFVSALLTRMVSFGSVVAAVAFPVVTWLVYGERPVLAAFSVVVAGLVIWRHRSNIGRIARGEESKISWSGRGAGLRKRSGNDSDSEGGS